MVKPDALNFLLKEVTESAAHPRTTILIAHGLVELGVNSLVGIKCANAKRILKDTRTYPHSARIVILNEVGALHHDELQLFDRFRKLRNDTVHDVHFQPSNERLFEVKGEWPLSLKRELASGRELNQNLVVLCMGVVAQMWGRKELSDVLESMNNR